MATTAKDKLRDDLYGHIARYCMATGVRYGFDRLVEAAVQAVVDEAADIRRESQMQQELSV